MKTKLLYVLPLLMLSACDNSEKTVNEKTIETVEAIVKTDADFIKEGKTIAENTFKVLSSNLQQAMAEGGIEKALSYCNINAMPLTDSLSQHYNVTIKRVSSNNRNPLNKPTKQEQKIIDDYLARAEARKPIIEKNENDNPTFYAPIITKGLCLNCHGIVGETLLPENNKKIKLLYPTDKAVGYQEGDLRGIWAIEFKK